MTTTGDPMTVRNPAELIAEASMRPLQVAVVALCVALNALDGFDVLSISFASPGIARDWDVDRAALGVVLSVELFGMTAGSLALGALCDRWGRRPTVLLCLVIMATGMAAAVFAGDVLQLCVCRFYTGLGIGGMLAGTNAIVAEFASARRKNLAVTLMAGGYPLGAVAGGTFASAMLTRHDWPVVFLIGATMSTLLLPVTLLLLPESVPFLCERRPPGALERINRVLARLGHDPVDGLPAAGARVRGGGLRRLFAADLRATTSLLTLMFVAHMMTFYFILKWAPKIVVDMGFAPSAAGGVLVWANIGGLAGSILFSLLSQRFAPRALAIIATLLSVVMVSLFGRSPADLTDLAALAAAAGVATNGTVVLLYALLATRFPTDVRALGTGFAIGIGRLGAAASPIIVGALFSRGFSTAASALVISAGSLVACAAITALRSSETPTENMPG